jgi:hypothetical protein
MLSDSFLEGFSTKYDSVECSFSEVQELSGAELLNKQIIFVVLPADLETLVFKEVVLLRENETIKLVFPHLLEGHLWTESKWAYDTFARTLAEIAEDKGIDCKYNEAPEDVGAPSTVNDIWVTFSFKSQQVESVGKTLREIIGVLGDVIRETEITLDRGIVWRSIYEQNETVFCVEVLAPLLRKMGFLLVRYTHGTREYGKDFTFSELTKFGELRHYGLQAKAGNISGRANSEIDEILGQITDAFTMPYYELGSKDARFISTFVVAISGHFTENAKEKIVEKMPRGAIGSVYFLDKEKITELVERYWSDTQAHQ